MKLNWLELGIEGNENFDTLDNSKKQLLLRDLYLI